jgi:hypothetical protein
LQTIADVDDRVNVVSATATDILSPRSRFTDTTAFITGLSI